MRKRYRAARNRMGRRKKKTTKRRIRKKNKMLMIYTIRGRQRNV